MFALSIQSDSWLHARSIDVLFVNSSLRLVERQRSVVSRRCCNKTSKFLNAAGLRVNKDLVINLQYDAF